MSLIGIISAGEFAEQFTNQVNEMNQKIKYFIMDVDGTLTDGKIYMSPSGEAMKAFNVKDGYGIHDLLMPAGITPVILTGRSSEILLNRCAELGITQIHQGGSNKIEKIKAIAADLSQVAYIGDDLNDIGCMKLVKQAGGLVGCPAVAVKEVKILAHFVAEHKGGEGAVRDFIDWLLMQLPTAE